MNYLSDSLLKSFPDYVEMLQKNDRYILACPPDELVKQSCEVDPRFIQEHILELIDDNEYKSLAGNLFNMVEHELHSTQNMVSSILS